MIDEQRHDLAIEYVLGNIEGDARREFEAWLQSDGELRAFVDEITETAGALALAAPPQHPAPRLRPRILAITRGESATATPTAPRAFAWIPWTLAAGLAIACLVLALERPRWHAEARHAKGETARSAASAQLARDEASRLAEQVLVFQVQRQSYTEQIAELRDEVVKLRGRDALAQVKIATLSAQVAEFSKAGVTIVWDPGEQRGVITLTNLPRPAEGKDYQLWVIDPNYPDPINGGIVTVGETGRSQVAFKPDQPIEHADKFAISVEQTGGVPKVAGPIIFLGE